MELVKSLGADKVIDYTEGDPTKTGTLYDVIFDAVGKTSYSYYRESLTPDGVYVTVAKGVVKERAEDLVFLRELIAAGKLKSVIDRRYVFEQISEAHHYVESGHKIGNVVITLKHSNNT